MEAAAETAVCDELSELLGARLAPSPVARIRGGCISDAYRWYAGHTPLFVKVGPARAADALQAEAAGLDELRGANAVRVPRVLAVGKAASAAFLALEWIEFSSSSRAAETLLGEQLARQHRITAEKFGWHRDNTIGSTPQLNERTASWVEFFRERRLRYQLDLARRNGYGGPLQEEGAALLERLPAFFEGYDPKPSLLHGDLWGGNWAADPSGAPVIFDPAVYYGDREADLAMTRLFGGFGQAFHAAYESAWPLEGGAAARVTLYNLYHVLNHLNLFGAGYLLQARGMISRLLASL